MVIVCDGLDEGSIDESSLLWRFLQGKCIGIPASLRLVVTTRPCKAAGKISQSASYRGVEVVGFTREDVALFACKYLGEELGKKMLSHLDKQPSVASLSHAPLFCLMICDLFQEEQKLPSTRTEIFEKVVIALLHRYATAHNLDTSFRGFEDAPVSLKELITGLGKVAFLGIQEQKLYFTDVELREAGLPAEALELGFLTKSESTKFWKRDEYTFSHLTVQEFLSALYVSSQVLHTEEDLAKLLDTVRFEDGHLSTFWVFLAGLLKGTFLECLLDALSSPRVYLFSHNPNCVHLLYRMFAENHLAKSGAPSASVGKILTKYQVAFDHQSMSMSDCAAICTVLQCHTESELLHTVGISAFLPDSAFTQLLFAIDQCCKSIQRFQMRHAEFALTLQHFASMSAVFSSNARTLKVASFRFSRIGDDGLVKLSEGLRHCSNLQRLHLYNTNLSSSSGETLGQVLSRLPCLKELDIRFNDLKERGLQGLQQGLKQCSNLQCLLLPHTGQSSSSGETLSQVLSCLPCLKVLNIDHNDWEHRGLGELQEGLKQCSSLQRLLLSRTRLSSKSCVTLGNVVSCLPCLKALDISQNNLGDSGLEGLREGLKQCKKLTSLGLFLTCLTSRSGSILGDIVSCLPNLEELAVSESELGKRGHKDLAKDLKQCTKLVRRQLV